jgi:hypothetical protein
MKTDFPSRMNHTEHPFQIKDPVSGVRVLASFIASGLEIEGRLAAWEIISLPVHEEAAAQHAAKSWRHYVELDPAGTPAIA